MKMVRLFIIFYLMMLDTSQEALIEKIHSSNREKDIDEETGVNVSKFNNAANLFVDSGTGSFIKLTTFFVEKTKIICDYDNLPIFWHQNDTTGKKIKIGGWLDENGLLSTHTNVATQCSPFKK